MEMRVEFTGGTRVEARFGKHAVTTDQPLKDGGEDSAPSPFALFLASLATCAGYFVLKFCQSRGISTEGMYLT
jgi:putative redox protein